MKPILRNIVLCVVFAMLMAGSVYGAVIPSNVPVSQIGAMQIAPFEAGLSLFQDYRKLYYVFSPFNDYVIDEGNNRQALISIPEIENNAYSSNLDRSYIEKISDTINMYVMGNSTSLTFKTSSIQARYTSRGEKNHATITKTVIVPESTRVTKMGSTLSYNGDDLVFDSYGNVYNFWETRDIETFSSVFQMRLSPSIEELLISIPDKKIFIMNPRATYIVVVSARTNQTLTVNRDAKLIEVEEAVTSDNNTYKTEVDISVVQHPKEVL